MQPRNCSCFSHSALCFCTSSSGTKTNNFHYLSRSNLSRNTVTRQTFSRFPCLSSRLKQPNSGVGLSDWTKNSSQALCPIFLSPLVTRHSNRLTALLPHMACTYGWHLIGVGTPTALSCRRNRFLWQAIEAHAKLPRLALVVSNVFFSVHESIPCVHFR